MTSSSSANPARRTTSRNAFVMSNTASRTIKMSCPQDPDGSNCSDFKIVASPSNSEESSSAAEDAANESTAEVEKAKLKPTTPYSKLCAYCQTISDNLMTSNANMTLNTSKPAWTSTRIGIRRQHPSTIIYWRLISRTLQ
jgi:hypothetical protein